MAENTGNLLHSVRQSLTSLLRRALQRIAPSDAAARILASLNETQKRQSDRLDDIDLLLRVLLTGPDRIIEFRHEGRPVRMVLPQADRDPIQRNIVRTGCFYQIRQLQYLRNNIRRSEGGICLDVGSNIGNHALYFAMFMRFDQVIGFEPDEYLCEIARRNIELNGIGNIALHDKAVSDSRGSAPFAAPEGGEPAQNVGSRFGMLNVDGLGLEGVRLIRVDAGGFEIECLGAMRQTMTRCLPDVYVQASDRSKSDVVQLMFELDYELRRTMHESNLHFAPKPRK